MATGRLCFADPLSLTSTGTVTAIAIGDWNGGGADILVGVDTSILSFAGDGLGSFSTATDVSTGLTAPIYDLAAGQLDTGASLDILVGTEAGARALFGDGSGGVFFESSTTGGEGYAYDVQIAQIQGSSASQDIFHANQFCGAVNATSGAADATFNDSYLQVCDGKTGLVGRCSFSYSCTVTASGSNLNTRALNPNTTPISFFSSTPIVTALEGTADRLASGTLDTDETDDVAVIVPGNKLNVLFSDGESGWLPQGGVSYKSYAVGANPSDVAVGDLDGDGDLDIAVANAGDDTVSILTNDGTGSFTVSSHALPVDASPKRISVGDLNGDGSADIVLSTSAPSNVTVILSKL